MIVGHVMGLPIEESVVQLAAGGAGVGVTTLMALEGVRRFLRAVRRRTE